MRRQWVPFRSLLIATLMLVLSSLLALGIGVWTGKVGYAALACLLGGVLLSGGYLLWLYLKEAQSLNEYARRLMNEGSWLEKLPASATESAMAGALSEAIGYVDDIWRDRYRELEKQLENEERILDTLATPLILVDPSRKVRRANQAACDLFGAKLLARDLASALRNPAVLEAVDNALSKGVSKTIELDWPGAVERNFAVAVMPFRRSLGGAIPAGEVTPGKPGAAVVLLHEVTAIKRSEQMRYDFVANVSHELRTPLASLMGFIETLQGPARDDAAAHEKFLGIMHEQAARMSRLVTDLLSLSKIELDEHSQPTTKMDLRPVIRTVHDLLEQKAAKKQQQMVIAMPELLPEIRGDADQLTIVVQNLVDNAIKYSRDGGQIKIQLTLEQPRRQQRARHVILSVEDQGNGIAPEHLPRLTERFYRIDPARNKAIAGTGLGLAIVKHIINRHRGRLTIESQLGQGSRFSVYLPIYQEAAAKKGISTRPGPLPDQPPAASSDNPP